MRLCVPWTVLRQRLGEDGLAGARVVLEQQVTLTQHAGQRQPDHLGLAPDRQLDVGDELVERLGEPRGLLIGDGHDFGPSIRSNLVLSPSPCWTARSLAMRHHWT